MARHARKSFPNPSPWGRGERKLVFVVFLCIAAGTARADDFISLLPADTEVVLSCKVRHMFESEWLKHKAPGLRLIMDAWQKSLKKGELLPILKDLDLNVFQDIDRIIVAGKLSEPDQRKGLVIIQGRFPPERFKAALREAAKRNPNTLEIIKAGRTQMYGWSSPAGRYYFAHLDAGTLVATVAEKDMAGVLQQSALKAQPSLSPSLHTLLAKADPRSHIAITLLPGSMLKAVSAELTRKVPASLGKRIGQVVQRFDGLAAVSCGIILGVDEYQFRLGLDTGTPKRARIIGKIADQGLLIASIILNAVGDEKLQPVRDFIRDVRVTADGSAMFIRITVPTEFVELVLKFARF